MEQRERDIINKAIDEVYSAYESDHSLRSVLFIHPMFYNGTYDRNNSCQPEEPEPLMTKKEFISKIDEDTNLKWKMAIQVLFNYILKQL